jgi:ribosomal protein S18 acetylase RimI-like enzyme
MGDGCAAYVSCVIVRRATDEDRPFIVEMARLASGLPPRHPIPAPDDPAVLAVLPRSLDLAVVATADDGQRLGAAWCYEDDPPLLLDDDGQAVPELIAAVEPAARDQGVGAALLDAVGDLARGRAPALCLNVHLLNPAVRLYIRGGFRVAGRGRGRYGVAMSKSLDDGH